MEKNDKEIVFKYSKGGKMKMIGVWVPNDFNYLSSITGGPLITYDMAARMLGVTRGTFKRKAREHGIKTVKGTVPGMVRASEIYEFINKKEKEKATHGFTKYNADRKEKKDKEYDKLKNKGYSVDELRTIESRIYNPHSLKQDDGELRQQEI